MSFSKIITVLLVSVCFPFASSAQGIGDLFVNMPDEIVPYLNQSMRNEMVEMYRMGVDSNTKNKFDETSSVDTLSVDYARFNLSTVKTLELLLLPYQESDTLICAVTTIYGPAPYGKIDFYDSAWNHKSSTFLPEMNLPMDLVEKPDDITEEKYNELLKNLDPFFLKYTILPQTKELEISLSLLYDTSEQEQETERIIRKRMLNWDGLTFK